MAAVSAPARVGLSVYLNVYDVSRAASIRRLNSVLANRRSPMKFGGIFHAGVEVAGYEYSFGRVSQAYGPAATGLTCNIPREILSTSIEKP